jgi:hypothetical protein
MRPNAGHIGNIASADGYPFIGRPSMNGADGVTSLTEPAKSWRAFGRMKTFPASAGYRTRNRIGAPALGRSEKAGKPLDPKCGHAALFEVTGFATGEAAGHTRAFMGGSQEAQKDIKRRQT